MALPSTENFTGSWPDAAWTISNGDWDNTQNQGHPNENSESAIWQNEETYDGNHSSELTISTLGGEWVGPAVRVAADQYYGYDGNNAGCDLFKSDGAGSWTAIGSSGDAYAADDLLELQIDGTTLTPIKNSATDSSIGAQTDSTYSGGSAGICGYGFDATRCDDWTGDDLAAAPSGNPWYAYAQQ